MTATHTLGPEDQDGRLVLAKGWKEFIDQLANRDSEIQPTGPTLGRENCFLDIAYSYGVLEIRSAEDWHLEPNQRFRVLIWKRGADTHRSVTLNVQDSTSDNRVRLAVTTLVFANSESPDYILVYTI